MEAYGKKHTKRNIVLAVLGIAAAGLIIWWVYSKGMLKGILRKKPANPAQTNMSAAAPSSTTSIQTY